MLEDGNVRRIARLARGGIFSWLWPRLVDRLLRNEISHCLPLSGSELLVCYRKSLYKLCAETGQVLGSFALKRGSRPLGISVEHDGWVVFGEYGRLSRQMPVHVYAARYSDFAFHKVFSFPAGEVKHLHNVVWDRYERCYWVLTGDSDNESGILRLDTEFRNCGWLIRGSQLCRAVDMFVEKDHLLYGTDSETAENWIVSVEKCSGAIRKIHPVEGSSLGCARLGKKLLVATAVEPSIVNLTRDCCVYESICGEEWTRSVVHQKDRWRSPHFQFGTHVLPKGIAAEAIAIGGQAIRGLDGRFFIELPDES